MNKISIRFFDDKEVRAVWDEDNSKWWFAAVDIAAMLSESSNPANYWRVLKSRLIAENNQTITICNGFNLKSSDGKLRLTDTLDDKEIITLAKEFPGKKANRFIEWFTYSPETTDGKSRTKAYALFESGMLKSLEPGSIKCLQ